jgi:hypothetical protein
MFSLLCRYVLESPPFFVLQELKLGKCIEPAPHLRSKVFVCVSRIYWVNKTRFHSASGGSLVR